MSKVKKAKPTKLKVKEIKAEADTPKDCMCGAVSVDTELKSEFVYDVADFFKVFGDSTRIKILHLLLLSDELCVGDIAERLVMTQSAVSHQLRVLRQNNLVKNRKEGKVVFYSLDDSHVRVVIEQGFSHIKHKMGYDK